MVKGTEVVLKELKDKKFDAVYFLHGDESFFIDKITDFIENNALPESEKSFNQTILYGKDTTSANIIAQAKRFPMMTEKQVVIVKELNQLDDWGKEDAFVFWEKYLNKPLTSTILVLAYKHKTFNKTTKLYKLLEKKATVIETKKIYENQVATWATNYASEKKYKLEPKAAQMLTEAVGADLSRLAGEIDKLMLNIKQTDTIKEEDVEKFIGISKEYNIFELQKALIEKNALKATKILNYWEANPKKQPLIPTLAMLFGFFAKVFLIVDEKNKSDAELATSLKLNPYVLKEYKAAAKIYGKNTIFALQYLEEADLQCKGIAFGNREDSEILKELIFKILYLG